MKKQSKMGRPPSKNPRNVLLTIRLTPKERVLLREKAQASGTTITDYLLGPLRSEKEKS